MKPTVENFEILGLFGGKDVKLSFTNKVQIYIGENGLGKTTNIVFRSVEQPKTIRNIQT